MQRSRVLSRFADHVVVADGATGSELLTRLPAGAHLDLAAMEHPREVLDIHLAYLKAGAELLETATFAASRPRLERLQGGDFVETVNAAGVKLAREAREIAGVDALIGGSIGPLAGVLDMDEQEGRSSIAVAHAEQAAVLAGRGADLLILETFFRLDELQLAITAVRDVTDLPLVAMLTFPDEPPPQPYDEHAADVLALFENELLAAGVNCSPGPFATLEILEHLRGAPGPLATMPNAGTLVRRAGRILSPPATPSYLAEFARRAAGAGVVLVGGCCGTGPDHIRAMADAVKGLRPVRRDHAAVAVEKRPARPAAVHPESSLSARLAAGEFVRVVQVDPPKGTNTDRIVEACRTIAASGAVDAVDINSNPLARLRLDSLWLASEIQRTVGVATIPHVTPRDASLMGLQAQLLGAWRSGIRNLLAISGDPSQLGDYPGVHDVYHVDIFELVRSVSRMAEGFDCAGNPIGEPPSFFTGVAINPCADDLDVEIARMHRKVEAGAQFLMSQVFFEWDPWLRLLDRCGGSLPLPALVAVWPLSSLRLALRLHHEVPGIFVPDDLLAALEAAGPEAARVGAERAAVLLREAPRHAAGAYLIAPFKNPEEVLHLLDEAG
jgi:methionine synthase I (cobalamin-dependent)/5,10-methylenetetrahydrofolate reductase